MITISKIYDVKKEFKLLSSALRIVKRLDTFFLFTDNKENEYTYFIDSLVDRWKRLEISKDTMNKLHRYAIAYRHKDVTMGI